MDFVVDKISEDSFYINLLLGLPKQLEKYKQFGIKFTHISRKAPVSHNDICSWEHKHGVLLPEDLRNFYNSADGFLFSWSFNFAQEKTNIVGRIEINSLIDLTQVFGYENSEESGVDTDSERFHIHLGTTSKVYELVNAENGYKIVLIYLNSRYAPTVWVKTVDHQFYFLSDDFTTFFRMAIAHLGIPNWYLLFTPLGVPQWTESMIRLLAPNLLTPKRTIESMRRMKEKQIYKEFKDIISNKIDTNIFKCLPKITSSVSTITENDKFQTITKSPRRRSDKEKTTTKINKVSSQVYKKYK